MSFFLFFFNFVKYSLSIRVHYWINYFWVWFFFGECFIGCWTWQFGRYFLNLINKSSFFRYIDRFHTLWLILWFRQDTLLFKLDGIKVFFLDMVALNSSLWRWVVEIIEFCDRCHLIILLICNPILL